jgi:hypothetical protein
VTSLNSGTEQYFFFASGGSMAAHENNADVPLVDKKVVM